MGKFSREMILEKAEELARMIAETDEVNYFKKVEAKINGNRKVQEKIAEIKGLQKQAVNLQNYGKTNALQRVEEKIDQLEKEINEIPIVQDFKDSQYEVNELLQIVTKKIAETVTEEITKMKDEQTLKGPTD
ncbi:RicAFT regulatory complex protein RicA family protein [Fervidibacillus halotolerans]|uniref:YlbF family regulator n=1 Tax=Fervidibacillus halotolerans TaxID=2980027 RepID=A0A9E8M209_9BACI|nr:YlbF family regulator [Fervidibacillus halotolerans]WAA13522.1 YlbF family regulator [Fervidibacillus halotolerans]